MRRIVKFFLACAVLGAGGAWVLTRPAPIDVDFAAGHIPDPQAGALIYAAAGCSSCHAAPDATGADTDILSGGHAFASDFGIFYAPNISPSAQGIGGWSLPEFARAVTQGVSPDGQHYYPAFPYSSYVRMTETDVSDLFAYMQGLPPSDAANRPHDLGFPFTIRRTVGVWKYLYLNEDEILAGAQTEAVTRGRYLVEALAHCGECHTPRDGLGGLQVDRWLAGAPNPSGKGTIPNITPAKLEWSEGDIAYYLSTGFTPDFDSAGGTMAAVVRNIAKLPDSDRNAIAAYLKAVPPAE